MSPERLRFKMVVEDVPFLSEGDIAVPPQVELTAIQYSTYEYIIGEFLRIGKTPTIREICDQFGLKSTNSGSNRLRALANAGCIAYQEERTHSYIPAVPFERVRRITKDLSSEE